MTDRVRRRDLAIPGSKPRSRTALIVGAVIVVILVVLVWLALQTLGGHSTKS